MWNAVKTYLPEGFFLSHTATPHRLPPSKEQTPSFPHHCPFGYAPIIAIITVFQYIFAKVSSLL